MADEYIESNRRLWDEWTDIHESSEFYDLRSFIAGDVNPDERRGPRGVRLREYEIEAVGDVTGKELLHLQCHFGIDTLSWARLGAHVTGVDFSPKAIALARRVAREIGIVDATFVESNLYDLPGKLEGDFDVVYTGVGAINWLPDIDAWGRLVAHYVRPGGLFYMTDGHPVMHVFDDENVTPGELRLRHSYWSRAEPDAFATQGSYADPSAHIDTPVEYFWNHGLGEIITALAHAGLHIEFVDEHPWVEWPVPFLERFPDGTYRLPTGTTGELPLFFSLKATKPTATTTSTRLIHPPRVP